MKDDRTEIMISTKRSNVSTFHSISCITPAFRFRMELGGGVSNIFVAILESYADMGMGMWKVRYPISGQVRTINKRFVSSVEEVTLWRQVTDHSELRCVKYFYAPRKFKLIPFSTDSSEEKVPIVLDRRVQEINDEHC